MTPDPARTTGATVPGSRWSAVLAVLALAFAAYGSIVPLHFAPRPLDEAWFVFRHAIPVRVSATDFLVNILLMAPFAFFFLGALPSSRESSGRVGPALGAWAWSTFLSASLEFAQTYFPPRHPSLVDIAAQSAGAAIGAAVWVAGGPSILSAWRRWRARHGPATPAEWILWPYVAALFLARVMPLDLTASPDALRAKWLAGRVVTMPFLRAAEDPGRHLLQAAAGAGLWVPVAVLLVLSGRMGAAGAFFLTVALAGLVEGVRLLVISRVSDSTDFVTAALGAAIGAATGAALQATWIRGAGRRGPERQGASPRSPARAHPESARPSNTTSAEKE